MSDRRKLLIYNPENDIALGIGKSNFTAPKNAALLARYAAPVMWWMGEDGDEVLVEGMDDAEYGMEVMSWRERMTQLTGSRGAECVRHFTGEGECMPWGWSRYAARRCRDAGANAWPDEVALDKIRDLSHRRSSVTIAKWIMEHVDFSRYGLSDPELPVECKTMQEVRSAVSKWRCAYLKSPWSSSGRGVVRVDDVELERYADRVEGTVRNQGSIMVEKAYEKVLDFAMLFRSEAGRVRLIGYSVFRNSNGNAYSGNLLDSDERLKNMVAAKVGREVLDAVECTLEECLTSMLWEHESSCGAYNGYLGVDMMVTEGVDGKFGLVPFVELNLRMTMGVIAHEIYRRIGLNFGGEERRMEMEYLGGRDVSEEEGFDLIPRNRWFSIKVK